MEQIVEYSKFCYRDVGGWLRNGRLFPTVALEGLFAKLDITFLLSRYDKINLTMQMRLEHAYGMYEDFTEKHHRSNDCLSYRAHLHSPRFTSHLRLI